MTVHCYNVSVYEVVCGVVWCGVVWCGVVWCGVVGWGGVGWGGVGWGGVGWGGVGWGGVGWGGVGWGGVGWGVVWCGVVWCGVVWCGVVWCGVELSGVECDLIWCCKVCLHCNIYFSAGAKPAAPPVSSGTPQTPRKKKAISNRMPSGHANRAAHEVQSNLVGCMIDVTKMMKTAPIVSEKSEKKVSDFVVNTVVCRYA